MGAIVLSVEVAESYRKGRWVWRVRSSDNKGDTLLAVGLARTEAAARTQGEAVQSALAPIFQIDWRFTQGAPDASP